MSDCDAFIPHVGWLRHECGEEVIALLRQGYFEAAEQAFFWLHGRPGDVFIDGGAHIGLYSIIAHRASGGDARVIAVEPAASTARYLEANLAANGVTRATLVRSALWKQPGELRFAPQDPGKAAYAHVAFEDEAASVVPATTLDDVVEGSGAATIALAKIDVEGAEPEALQGAARSIARGTLPLLMVEFTEKNLERRGSSTAALREQLARLGYVLAELDRQTLQLVPFEEDGPIWFRNLFACADIGAVNARLAAAGPRERAIARDVLDRARACDRFRELEDLDRLRALEAEGASVRRWAEEADARAAAATRLAEERETWARDAEARFAAAKALADEQRAWAERSDASLAQAQAELGAHRADSQRLQDELANARAALVALEDQVRPLRTFALRHPRLARFLLRWFK